MHSSEIREGIETELSLRPVPQFEIETHRTFNTKGQFYPADSSGGSRADSGSAIMCS